MYTDCVYGRYGPGCQLPCNCEEDCDKITGHCPTFCEPGWETFNCENRKNFFFNSVVGVKFPWTVELLPHALSWLRYCDY